MPSFLAQLPYPRDVVTAIDHGIPFPEKLEYSIRKYGGAIDVFASLVESSASTGELLRSIRENGYGPDMRMALLKMFRRCACLVCDTERTKKIQAVPTEELIEFFGDSFKPISTLKHDIRQLRRDESWRAALAVLTAEYDDRGKQGYVLAEMFFEWFEHAFDQNWAITGPRSAGSDIELSSIADDFTDRCPCDFAVFHKDELMAVGFARYDSTRGGSQSDDRPGGNADKVNKIRRHYESTGRRIKVIFLADGPGLLHRDTWEEACELDDAWDGNVRVTTFALAHQRVTPEWLMAS